MLDSYESDACKMDGKQKEAKYYCADCEDYMCATCEAYHKKVKSTRLHNVLSGDHIPQKAITKRTTIADDSDSSDNKSTPAEDLGPSENKSTPAEDLGHESTQAEDLNSRTRTRSSVGAFLDATVTSHVTIDMGHVSDAYKPLVSGLAFNQDGELLVADYNNEALKIFDGKFTIKAVLPCEGTPYDVAIINDKEAVMTVIDKQWLLYVKFCPKLYRGRKVILKGCKRVTASKTNIFCGLFL